MLITIILTTLNSENYVAHSIDSCLTQTHFELELLVVDGGSKDKTLDIVRQYQDSRIRIINQYDNEGKLPGAINLGLEHSKGEFITWTQDDCWYEPTAIETMLNYLIEHQEVGLVYADYWEVDETGNLKKHQSVHPPNDMFLDDVIRVCFLFRREVYETIGPQEPKYHPCHEVPWRIKLADRFKIQPIHTPLMYYIVREDSLTGQIGNHQLRVMCCKILLEEGIMDQRTYRSVLSQTEIDQAYEQFINNGSYLAFWRFTISGIKKDFHWLRNFGLLKIMMISISPFRNRYRDKLLGQRSKELEQKSQLFEMHF